MQNKKLIRFVESFVLLPVMTIGVPQGFVPKDSVDIVLTPQLVLSQKLNNESSNLLSLNQEADQEAKILKMKALAIDTYFKEHDMPLEGSGMKMVQEAEKNDLDWRLLAGIAVIESTGGKFACKKVDNNPFGWGSCKKGFGFETIDKAIETIAEHLGGNRESTAKHYKGKNTKEILQKYNPPSIVPKYAEKVMSVMDKIGPEEVTLEVEA